MNDFIRMDSEPIANLMSYCKSQYINEYDFRLDVFKTLYPNEKILPSTVEFYTQNDNKIAEEFKTIFHVVPQGIKRLTAITLIYTEDFIPYFLSLTDDDFKNEFYCVVNNIRPNTFLFIHLRDKLAENAFKDNRFCDWVFSFVRYKEMTEWVATSMIKIACNEISQEKISYVESKICLLRNIEIFTAVLLTNIDYNKTSVSWIMCFLSECNYLTQNHILEMIGTAVYKKQSISPIVNEIKKYNLFSSYQDLAYAIHMDQDYFDEKESIIHKISTFTGVSL